ncbi:MAG: hypothetical protein ABSA96_00180 [Candidatus Acidiferrales bacterium]|jgi:Tfp pilus assembly protein PilE
MQTKKEGYSFGERMLVVAILVLVSVIALNNVLQTVKSSEERTMNAASVEYSAVRKMYADTPSTAPQTTIQASAMQSETYPSASTK